MSSLESLESPSTDDVAEEVEEVSRAFNILVACSSNCFIDGSSLSSPSSFFLSFPWLDGVSSPSTFWIFGLVGEESPPPFGLEQALDICSVDPQVQHLLFSSF